MSLPGVALHLIKNVLESTAESGTKSRKVMSLGYPDILVPVQFIRDIFGNDVASRLEFHPDSESIARWHGISHLTNRIIEAKHFFSLLGFDLEVVDISLARGDEIILNLNQPCPSEMHERYALVMDGGTIEHCFNIAQAMKNLASMVSLGGWIYQSNPLNAYNHGFFNLNPTFYFDFYNSNGFSVEFFKIVTNPHNPEFIDVPTADGFHGIPEGASNILVANRQEMTEIVYPIQAKYRANPSLRG